MTHSIKRTLNKIHFTHESGLVFCDNPKSSRFIGERYYIQEKALKLEATAVLFRRKYDGEKITDSKPVLHIFQKDNNFFNSDLHWKLHADIWSAGDIDVYFILSETRIDIINARKPAEVIDKQELDINQLRLVSEALEQFDDQRFSAMVFNKGVFWEQEDFFNPQKDTFYNNQLKEENTPFHQLLEHLMIVRQRLHDEQKELPKDTIDKLLIICILIKFLEEIRDDDGKHTLRGIYRAHDVKDFSEALDKGICLSILNELGKKFKPEFNGNVFDNFSLDEKQQIQKTKLSFVADFLRADIDPVKGQYFLWKQYSFNYLPVELISAIYESFLPKEKGVVYTPPFLVNFLIDNAMPLDKAKTYFLQNQFKVFDPSCGSGVFLVAAYKRMLQWWSINNQIGKSFSKPDQKICQEILQKNIFGVDINPTATLISVFSLTIALLERLEPKEIWNNLKLHRLKDNIQETNFFKWVEKNKDERFDLVIGNPPFNPSANISKKEAVSNTDIQLFGITNEEIPDNNFALKFFEGALFLGKKTCMVLPSNVLLYQRGKSVQKYRNRIFTNFTIEKIFDFTHLRRELFNSVDTPVCVVMAKSSQSQGQKVEHTVIKRISHIEKKVLIEIDYYDRHFVPYNWITDESKQFVWKTNLLGGGRLFYLIYRLSMISTLKDFINSRNDWKEIRGFEGGSNLVATGQDIITGITESGEPEIKRDVDIYSNSMKDVFMYTPPFMIIEQVIGKNNLSVCFVSTNNKFTRKDKLYYNRDFIGISVPPKDEKKLECIFNAIRQNHKEQLNYQLYVLSVSSSVLVLKETGVNKSEILSVPYLSNDEDALKLSESEKIIQEDVLKYFIHLGKSISEKGQGKILYEKVSPIQLEKFGAIFCNTLNPIYAKNGKAWQCGTFYQTQTFTICQFGYGKNEGLSFQFVNELDEIIKPLIYDNKSNRGAMFKRICRIYKHLNGYDCVFLIKPHALYYWLNSTALRDADETFIDLKRAGR